MQCANCIGWNCGNEGKVTIEGRKDYTLLNAERMVYVSSVINAFKKDFVFC